MKKKNNNGFTLIEVLLALVITVMAVTIVAQGFTQGARAGVVAQKITKAALIAEQLMTDVELGELAYNRSDEGEWSDDPLYRWELETDQSEIVDVYQVTIKVLWDDRNREETFTLVRLFYKPEESGE